MKRFSLILPGLMAMAVILDSRCAVQSVREGLRLCFESVIPGLFPLLVLTGLLLPALGQVSFPRWLRQLLGLPRGAEGFYLLGCVGGFPVGAQAIGQAVEEKRLSLADAGRMLGLCSEAGPAFVFGILPALFRDSRIPAMLFFLQLESAFLTAALWPKGPDTVCTPKPASAPLPRAVSRAVRSMALICGWILLASVLTRLLQKWTFGILPPMVRLILTGLTELSTGCLALQTMADEGLRMMLCCGFLCFGGVSVLLQIHSVCPGLSMKPCIAQKSLQALIGLVLCAGWVRFGTGFLPIPMLALCFYKKVWHFPVRCGIIPVKREESDHVVS